MAESVVTKSSVMLRVQRAEAGGLHGQRHDQSVRVLQQRKGVQQGQVKGCEVRPLPPLAKPSFWYAFAHAFVSELGRCNGTHSVPVRRISLECNVSCQCRHENGAKAMRRAEALEQQLQLLGTERLTVADEKEDA